MHEIDVQWYELTAWACQKLLECSVKMQIEIQLQAIRSRSKTEYMTGKFGGGILKFCG